MKIGTAAAMICTLSFISSTIPLIAPLLTGFPRLDGSSVRCGRNGLRRTVESEEQVCEEFKEVDSAGMKPDCPVANQGEDQGARKKEGKGDESIAEEEGKRAVFRQAAVSTYTDQGICHTQAIASLPHEDGALLQN